MENAYIYTRVSTLIQVDGFSLEAQEAEIRAFAEARKINIVGKYTDEGKSGKNAEHRPAFTQMMEDIRSKKDNIRYVLVFKLSRFARNTSDTAKYLQELSSYGIGLLGIKDGIDTSTVTGKMIANIMGGSLNRILDDLYEKIEDAQTRLDEVNQEITMVEKSAMTKKSIFEMLEGFSKYYDVMSPEDKKALLQAMVSFIELYPEKRDDKHLIKTIHFTFPVTYDGESGALFVRTNKQQVETVVLLSKEMVDSRKVKVDFSLENMDLSEFKGKATYEQIKAYVLEQTGLKVSSLYIAQIKKKCGLDVGENFNLSKSENARQPQCTPEKEEAIMQAFKHFGMI